MSALPIREALMAELDTLSERELEAVLRYVKVMQSTRLPDDYDEDRDPQERRVYNSLVELASFLDYT